MSYPRILIVGQQFNKKSGAGITLTNLFYDWDKNNIAVAASEIYNPDFSVCDKYYLIGDQEIKRGFPFNLKFSEEHQKSNVIGESINQKSILNRPKQTESKLGKIKDQLLFLTGQIHRRRKFVISKEFSEWINEFSPEIIYSQLSSLELIHFISKLKEHLNKPLVIHLMDDWPKTISNRQTGIFRTYWAHLIDKELRKLFNKADVLLSISEAMSEEYLIRYGKIFLPFHNPINVEDWTSSIKKDYTRKDTFIILYAGRIGTGLQNCLLSVAYSIKNLVNKGLKIEFHIQSVTDNPVLKELNKFDFVTLRSQVSYDQLPQIFSSVDLLLLPNDFDEKSVSFLKYSMPTKASEYMVSGTPILVFSSSETAITKHAFKYDWAYVVSEDSNEKIESAIKKLYEDENLRKNIGCRAKEFAIMHFESGKIRENFKNSIKNQS
jgi:glycosyltransferase involved in cell wall biosynthesis